MAKPKEEIIFLKNFYGKVVTQTYYRENCWVADIFERATNQPISTVEKKIIFSYVRHCHIKSVINRFCFLMNVDNFSSHKLSTIFLQGDFRNCHHNYNSIYEIDLGFDRQIVSINSRGLFLVITIISIMITLDPVQHDRLIVSIIKIF